MRYFVIEVFVRDNRYGARVVERTQGHHGSTPETRFSDCFEVYPEHPDEKQARAKAELELKDYLDRQGGDKEHQILSKASLR